MANVILGNKEKVCNVIGTGTCTTGDGLWKKFWLGKSGKQWLAECCIWGCTNSATDGAHVELKNRSHYYILPMCHTCNTSKLDEWLRVNANSLPAPVLEEDTAGTGNCYRKKN